MTACLRTHHLLTLNLVMGAHDGRAVDRHRGIVMSRKIGLAESAARIVRTADANLPDDHSGPTASCHAPPGDVRNGEDW
jgi:hypothetical protein